MNFFFDDGVSDNFGCDFYYLMDEFMRGLRAFLMIVEYYLVDWIEWMIGSR